MLTSRIIYSFFIFILVFTNIDNAYSQVLSKTGSGTKDYLIKGIVVDSSTNRPLEFVTLILKAENGVIIKTATTSENGSFELNIKKKGGYVFSLSYMGYKNYTSPLITINGETIKELGRIGLQQESGMLREVVVKSRKAIIQSKGDKLIYNASADIGNKNGSATDVLRKAPMVTVGADGEVKMRGSSNIKVLLNGLSSGILAKNLKEALKMIPASTIESIEVITAPSAKYEAEGAAGIINIVTKKKMKGTSGNVDLNGGNLEQSANVGLNIAAGKFNFNLSGNANMEKERTVSELNRKSFTANQQTGNLLQRTDALQKSKGVYGDFTAEYKPDSAQKLGATISLWNGNWPVKSSSYNLYNANQGSTEYNQTGNQGGKFNMMDLSLNYQKKFKRIGQELQLAGQLSNSRDQSDYLTDQYYLSGQHYFREQSPNKGDSKDMSLQADYTHPLNKTGKHIMETGIRYDKTRSSSTYTVFNNRNNPGSPVLMEDPSRSNTMDYFQNVFAAYISLKFETESGWTFRPGVRYENTHLGSEFQGPSPSFKATFSNFVPGILIAKKLNDHHELKLNYTERIRRPEIWDLNPYVNASDPLNLTFGNPELRPEITKMLEMGHAYSAESGFTLNSSLYFNSNSNTIESLTTVDNQGISRTTSQNIAANKRLGTNLNAYLQANQNWTVSAGAEFYRVWFKSKALNVANDANFYSVNLNSSYTLPKDYTVEISADYSNGYVTLQGRNSANYSYRFSARKEFLNNKASITVGLNNPFQKTFLQKNFASAPTFNSNTSSRYYNRSFAISFSWRFGNMKPGKEYEKEPSDQKASPLGRKRR